MEEIRAEMTFAELAILHELVYSDMDADAKERRTRRKKSINKPVSCMKIYLYIYKALLDYIVSYYASLVTAAIL